jgi:flagellar assembly factor FliW
MLINTQYFGDLSIQENQLITFEEGLPGFEDQKKFVLLNNYDTEDPVPFMWLQSTANPDLALVVAIPFFLKTDYEVTLTDEVVQKLAIQNPEDVAVYSVVRIKDTLENMTYNLASPIVINGKTRKGMQFVQDTGNWRVDEAFTGFEK